MWLKFNVADRLESKLDIKSLRTLMVRQMAKRERSELGLGPLCLSVLAMIRVKVQQCAESPASSEDNKQAFQARDAGGGRTGFLTAARTRPGQMSSRPITLSFTPTHTCTLTFPTPTTQI